MAEDRKFYNDKKSSHPVSRKYGGGDHVFVPFAMEDGGTLGAHGLIGSPEAVGGVCCGAWLL